jgi:signal transduction histidine kinase
MITPMRARQWMASSRLADVAIAIGVAGATVLLDAFGPDHRGSSALVWDAASAAPLVIRRRSPAACGAAIAAVCLLQWASDVRAVGGLALLVALYAIGSREQRRWVLPVAVVVAQLGVALAVSRWVGRHDETTTGLLLTGTVTAAWVLGLYVRTRRAYVDSVIDRAVTAERERDSRDRMAVTDERVRIAREMHDVVAHGLSVMISLNDGAAALADDGQVHDAITQAAVVGRQALAEMRLMLGVLRSPEPAAREPQPGVAQLSDLVDTARSAGLAVRLGITGELADLGPSAQLTVYRIVQESLTNVLKHARNVSHVAVDVAYARPGLSVVVANDGEVVSPPATPTSGHGLTGMKERAELHEGHVHAGPTPAGGWNVTVRLAMADDAARPLGNVDTKRQRR